MMHFSYKVLVCLIISFSFAANVNAERLEKLARKLEKGLKNQSNKKVAVLNFPYHNGRFSNGSSIIQERLTTFLAERGKVEVIERHLLRKILEEMRLEKTGIMDEKTSQELGKVLGVGAVVTGTLNDISMEEVEVNARVIQTETGKVLAAGQSIIRKTWIDAPFPGEENTPSISTGSPASHSTQLKFRGKPLMQIAILLDTSNSMDGLIAQTKSQLWKIVNNLASAEKDNNNPELQVALFEYGNDNLSSGEHHIRQILPFTTDLDKVSEELFALKTRGGQEYCGAVVLEAVNNLQWDEHSDVYKTIFIAGNEPFTQGPVDFRVAVSSAINKEIIVNTIFCGNRQEGITTQWMSGALAGKGEYLHIDQQAKASVIPAPQDEEIQRLGKEINQTFIPYGQSGTVALKRQAEQDSLTFSQGSSGFVERSLFKAKVQYSSATWDLATQVQSGGQKIELLQNEHLPQEMREMNTEERKKYIETKITERREIQKKLNELNSERMKFITRREREMNLRPENATLDQVMIPAIRSQAEKKNFRFK